VFAFEAPGLVLEFRVQQRTPSLVSKFGVLVSTIVRNIIAIM